MVTLISRPLPRHIFICDACGEEIEEKREVCLMYPSGDEAGGSVFHVHDRCVEQFLQRTEGQWEQVPFLSPQARQILK